MTSESLSASVPAAAPVAAPSPLSTPGVATTLSAPPAAPGVAPSPLFTPDVRPPTPHHRPTPYLNVAASQPLAALAAVATPKRATLPSHLGPMPRPSPSSSRSIQASPALPRQQMPESSPERLDWGSIDEEDGAYAITSLQAASTGSASALGSGGAIDGCAGP
jgi:hypothetical protein